MRADVVLTDVGFRPEPRQLAVALSERGVPFKLHTSAYFGDRSIAVRAASAMPGRLGPHARAFMLRRRQVDLDSRQVARWFFPDVVARILMRLRVPDAVTILIVNTLFDRFAALLVRRRADIVVCMEGAALATLRRSRRLGAKTVLLANAPDPLGEHAVVTLERERLGLDGQRVTDAALERLGRRIRREFALADLVVANSTFTRDDLIAHGVPGAKVAAVPLGVDVTLFTPSPRRRHEDQPATVLFVGGVAPRKGVIHLARAVDALRREGVPCVLNAYGTGNGAYLRLLAPFIASGAMRLEGFVPHDRLPDVYCAADVFAFPTLSDGFGLVVYEAMACGVPVVVSDRCGADIRDRVNGLVVPHGDDDALAGAIRCLLEDPRLAQSLAAEGLATARDASWARYRESIVTEVLAAGGTAKGSPTGPLTVEAVS